MPWKECNVEKNASVSLLDGENIPPVAGLNTGTKIAASMPTKEVYAFSVFERAFKDFGLPKTIRTDNGVPFASPNALYGLSRLSVWWLRLGIHIERIKPATPNRTAAMNACT